ncbi:uncharacterized protein LOC124932679 isoform X2 [Impatiens glandulifera]|uniref:uncharacterized protein LOC124932679 isoform X2 n=1 Tax=Impatiens glandulifera TaxID=253017 RepID=UPI001FB16C99|nr:uncharacterized protein LOC124932679 isoform X2 [Impatiens glandulifera]
MADILNNNNNNNQGPAFWLPPDFLSDEDDADDFLIPTAAPEDTFLHHSYFSSFPQKPPFNYSSPSPPPPPHHQQIMDTTDRLFIAAAALSSTYFPCCPSKKQQLISPLPGIIGGTTGRIFKTPNGFLFPHRPSPPPKNPPPPPLVAALYAADYNKGLPLKHNISPIKTNNRDVYCSQQKFMLQNNRQGNRVIGYGGSETTVASPPHSSAAAWPPLSQQRLNPPPPLNDGSHQVKRKCAGTGVFLPRRYGTPLSDFQNKPDLAIPSDQVPMRKNPVLFESPFIQNLAAMAARNRKVQLMNPQQRLSFGTDELCLPQEWAY